MTINQGKRKLGLTLAIGLFVISIFAVFFVLPAEFGWDPTGVGRAMGVDKISQNTTSNKYLEKGLKRKGVFVVSKSQPPVEPGVRDSWEFELGPFEGIELKYEINAGEAITFFWSSELPLDYDMHAHPFEGGEEYTESYSIAKADHLGGRYQAAFTGIHGWYWQNRNLQPVKVALETSGKMRSSKIFNKLGERERQLESN